MRNPELNLTDAQWAGVWRSPTTQQLLTLSRPLALMAAVVPRPVELTLIATSAACPDASCDGATYHHFVVGDTAEASDEELEQEAWKRHAVACYACGREMVKAGGQVRVTPTAEGLESVLTAAAMRCTALWGMAAMQGLKVKP